MAVVINNFEAVADDGAAPGGASSKAKSPVTSNARTVRAIERLAARRNRLRAN
jgi:hypothetical protein